MRTGTGSILDCRVYGGLVLCIGLYNLRGTGTGCAVDCGLYGRLTLDCSGLRSTRRTGTGSVV